MPEQRVNMPSARTIRTAISLYLEVAWPGETPPGVAGRLPPEPLDVAAWLAGDAVERDPPEATPQEARTLSLRLGNRVYPHMKLRMSRPPHHDEFVFTVDSHDSFLTARGDSDAAPLEELKRHNAEVARAIHERWEDAGVPTERSYLRAKLVEAQQRTPPPKRR